MSAGNRYHEGPFSADLERRGNPIRDDWRPQPVTLERLQARGVNRYQANQQLRIAFIQAMRRADVRNADWDSRFEAYVAEQLPAAGAAPAGSGVPAAWREGAGEDKRAVMMTDEWQPSAAMRDLILRTLCPEDDYLNSQLVSFTSHFHGQFHPNWDQKFRQWINNGWNVYGHKNHYGQNRGKGQKGFVETHTDRSWADDL